MSRPREVPVHKINVEYVDTTPEYVQSFVDDLTGNPLSLISDEEPVRYSYLRESSDRLKVLVLVLNRPKGFDQRRALLHVYEYVRETFRITDGLRDSLDADIDELRERLGL